MQKIFATTFAFTALLAFAQGSRGPQSPNRPASTLNMTNVQTVTGAVTSVNIAYGAQYPAIAVNKTLIKVAPVWFFLEKNFELKAGDEVSVVAAPSALPGDSYLYAIEITNVNTKARIVLRDAAGVPLWSGPGGGRGNPDIPPAATACIDAASITSVSGTVEKVSAGVGIQMPALVIKTAEGALVSMKIGPERILLEADFELQEGEQVTAKHAHETCTDENVALQLTNAAGVTLILRTDDGIPNW